MSRFPRFSAPPLAVLLALTTLALPVLSSGCTTERDPVWRAPYEALDKRMFEGEFLYKQTVVDLPYSVDYTFIGETAETKIIRWEITKNWLIAYNIHDKINARDSEGRPFNNKTPLLAFPIAMHFDIRYAENSMTGEDLPIHVPNTDQKWNEAPYFIISASASAITTFPGDLGRILYPLEYPYSIEPVTGYWEAEFYDKDRNYLEGRNFREMKAANPGLAVDEMNLHTMSVYTPNVSLNGWWRWTREEFFFRLTQEPARVKYRHTFKRFNREEISKNNFVRVDMDDYLFRRFGFFRSSDIGIGSGYIEYDHTVGTVTDRTWYQWANYFNTEIDPATNRPRQIVYRINTPEYPKRMVTSACAIAAEFNEAFKEAVAARDGKIRNSDQLPTPDADEQYIMDNWNSSDPAIQAQVVERCLGKDGQPGAAFADPNTDVFVLKGNAWEPYIAARDGVDFDGRENAVWVDPWAEYPYVELPSANWPKGQMFKAACELTLERRCATDEKGKPVPRLRYRLGDVDTSFLYWVSKPTDYGILGVAQWSANPETGQIFSGVGHIAGAVMAGALERAMDQFDYLAGLKSIDDIIDPEYRRQPNRYVLTNAEANMEKKNAAEAAADDPERPRAQNLANLNVNELSKYLIRKTSPPLSGKLPLEALKGTKWEYLMMNKADADFWSSPERFNTRDGLDAFGPMGQFGANGVRSYFDTMRKITEKCYLSGEMMDGVMAAFAEEALTRRDSLVASGKSVDEATNIIRTDMYARLERMLFKGVAQHEIGHSIGLRHNFTGSTDERNYIGPDPIEDPDWESKPGYWKAKKEWDQRYRTEILPRNRNLPGRDLHELGEAIAGMRNLYRYSSVMDYQSEPYIHAAGLGRYDKAAIKFMYGKIIEKYEIPDGDNSRLRLRYEKWYTSEGQSAHNVPKGGVPYEPKVAFEQKDGAWVKKTYTGQGGTPTMVPILDNGDVKPYRFCPDGYMYEDAFCKVWDKGVTGREIVRNMARDFNFLYYYRFFRRGNPRFSQRSIYDFSWIQGVWRIYFPMAHYALDYNYNRFRDQEWMFAHFLPYLRQSAPDILNSDPERTARLETMAKSRSYALGKADMEDRLSRDVRESDDDFDAVVYPRSIGDYIVASMEAFNFMVFDVLYRPDVGAYTPQEYNNVPFDQREAAGRYWNKNQTVFPDSILGSIDDPTLQPIHLGIDVGRHHKNRWDIQDDPSIVEERFMRRGFEVEKLSAVFTITNTGWPPEKYGRENMANGFHYISDGFRNAIFKVLSDVNGDDQMLTFASYCLHNQAVVGGGGATPQAVGEGPQVVHVRPPLQAMWLFGATDLLDFYDNLPIYKLPARNLCESVSTQLEPLHAGWIYFDKTFHNLWAMTMLSNISADVTVFDHFTAQKIPAGQYDPANGNYGSWGPLDPETQVEFRTTSNQYYYRATKALDGRDSPAYDMVKTAAQIRQICDTCKWRSGLPAAGTPQCAAQLAECQGWRTLEITEANLANNADFAHFWGSLTGQMFGRTKIE